MAAIVLVALAGCTESKPVGTIGYVKGFGGMVAADEPRAVLAARDILQAGGTAADAAVALYFTMAVTQPSTASLGGGGVCVVYDKEKKRTEVVEFLAPPSQTSGNVRNPSAVPANVRGFYALHAKYGKFRWEQLLGEPERLARMGTPVSRAFATDIARAAQLLANDPAARQIFLPAGRPLAEGQTFEQRDLAALLSRLRRSPGDMYQGAAARDLIDAVKRADGSLTAEDLRDLKPYTRDGLTVSLGDDVAYFAPPPAVAGGIAAQMTAALADRWGKATPEEKPHLLAEASAKSFADRARWMQPHGWPNENANGMAGRERATALLAGYNPEKHSAAADAVKSTDAIPAAGFVIMDSDGGAVACNVTTYGLFGNGRMAPGTGIFLAAVPGLSSGPPAVGPVLVVNNNSREVHFGGAATGGVTGPTALVQTLLTSVIDNKDLDSAVAAPRVHHSGTPDIAFVESGERAFDPASLTKRGHEVKAVPMPSRVNAFTCASGAASFQKCRVVTDPRGNGLGVIVGKD
ncbi:MAG: gamma-glutamyltransferase [Rhodospirillaceae bacterium]|nr:gamma-glutamyltransferase [Rhodospirillales bacterium]